jgi:hypothetical protein
MILDDQKVTFSELNAQNPRFVIVSYSYIMSQWRRVEAYADFWKLVQMQGLDLALQKARPRDIPDYDQRLAACLFSPVGSLIGGGCNHLILDQGHAGKNATSRIHSALFHLPKRITWILSDSFLDNKWSDAFGICRLLPGEHPFKVSVAWSRAFAGMVNRKYQEPSVSKRNRLIKWLQGFTICRPANSVELPPCDFHNETFLLDPDAEALVGGLAFKFMREFQRRGHSSFVNLTKSDKTPRALIYATRAMQAAASPIITPEKAKSMDDIVRAQGRKLIDDFVTTLFDEGADDENSTSSETHVSQFVISNFSRYIKEMHTLHGKVANRLPAQSNAATVTKQAHGGDDDNDEDKDPDAEHKHPQTDWNDDQSESDDNHSSSEAVEEDLDPLVGTRDRKAWLEQIRHLPKEKLQSPRINRVVEIVVHIMDQYPGESIVVFSQFPSLLDILGLILTEHAAIISHGFNVMRYDSDVALSKRQDVVERFNQEKNKTVLLMTSESSSHGLNLQNAAHVVQTEPWWNRDHEYQAYHRLYRQGDTKNVHVWRIFGANSTIDYLIRGIADGEHARNESILEKLTVAYDQFPEIPHQFKGGVGE